MLGDCGVSVSMTDELPVDFLARLRVLAGREAAELGHSAVDEEHLLLAVTRDELGCVDALGTIGVGRRQLRDFVMFIGGVNESRAAQDQSRPYQRTRKREPVDALPPVRPGHPKPPTWCGVPPPRPLATTGPLGRHIS
jgi:hypothetical protein